VLFITAFIYIFVMRLITWMFSARYSKSETDTAPPAPPV